MSLESARIAAGILRRPLAVRFNLLWLRDTRDPGGPHYGSVAAVLKAGGEAGDDLAREALDGAGWAADARAKWAVDLMREASALVTTATEAAGLVLEVPAAVEEERTAWFPGGVSGVTVQHPGAELEPVEGEHPDGPALALDLAGIESLEELAAKLGKADSAGAELLRAEARVRWAAFQADPDGYAADPVAEALAEHAPMLKVDRLTNRAALWRWWVREEKPNGDVEVVAGDSIATHKAELGPWRFYQLDPDRERVFIAEVLPAPFLRFLAWVLWQGRWRAEAERLKSARETLDLNPAGLVAPVYGGMGDALVLARPDYDTGRLVAADGRQLPLLPATALDRLTGAPALGKLTAQRLVRWLVWSAAQGWHLGKWGRHALASGVVTEHHRTGVNLTVSGGLAALQEAIGARSNKASNEIRDVLNVLAETRLEWDAPGDRGSETLIGWREETEHTGPESRAVLTIRVGPLLCPGLAPMIPKGSRDRLIVPVLPLPPLEDLHSRQRTAAARLDWLAVRYFAESGREAKAHGGVFMPWDRLAKDAGLSKAGLRASLAAWTSGDAPRWVEVTPGRWDLGEVDPTVKAARDFILAGAERSEKGAAAGRRSGAARRRKLGGKRRKR